MKNNFVVVLLAALALTSCSKSAEEFSPIEEATIYSVKYPCGPACTGQAWILETASGTTYEPANLHSDFASHELPVEVAYRKTGKRSNPNSGTGEELIIIEQIRKR
jgi:hypothetical protein